MKKGVKLVIMWWWLVPKIVLIHFQTTFSKLRFSPIFFLNHANCTLRRKMKKDERQKKVWKNLKSQHFLLYLLHHQKYLNSTESTIIQSCFLLWMKKRVWVDFQLKRVFWKCKTNVYTLTLNYHPEIHFFCFVGLLPSRQL